MGSSMSTELLAAPLHAQPKPFRLSDYSAVAVAPTTLRIQIRTMRSTLQVFDNHTSELLYEIKAPTMSSRLTIHTPDGTPVFSIKNKAFSDYYRVYESTTTDTESFVVNVRDPVFSPLIVFAEFEDKVSRGNCRVLVEGGCGDAVAVVYLERGWPNLSSLEKRDNGGHPQYQAIGRIHRKDPRHEELVEVAPGVDLTLVLLLWLIRYKLEKKQISTVAAALVVV